MVMKPARKPIRRVPPAPPPSGSVLTVSEVAEYVGVGEKTIYHAIESKRLKARPVNRRGDLRIRIEWVDRWLDAAAEDAAAA
jgi:excisionase family DNA binding protein